MYNLFAYINITTKPKPNTNIFSIIKLLLIKAYENITRLKPILMKAYKDRNNSVSNLIIVSFAIIPSGIKYNPMPRLIEVKETFNQFSETIPEAIKTVPHTGGVMVDNKANQNTNKCT